VLAVAARPGHCREAGRECPPRPKPRPRRRCGGGLAALALVGAYELLTAITRSAQTLAITPSAHDDRSETHALGDRAAVVFAADLTADHIPSIRAALYVGQPRAQRLRGYLATVAQDT
jgi:hypothetical protein